MAKKLGKANTGGIKDESPLKLQLLLELLMEWRIIIEYDQENIRKVEGDKKGQSAHHVHLTGNASRTENCWIHKENGEHPIWTCKVFKEMSVSDRVNLANEHKACHACLEIQCPGASNPVNCRKNFQCIVDHCTKKHNKLLHTDS